jgi:hypothetical protein
MAASVTRSRAGNKGGRTPRLRAARARAAPSRQPLLGTFTACEDLARQLEVRRGDVLCPVPPASSLAHPSTTSGAACHPNMPPGTTSLASRMPMRLSYSCSFLVLAATTLSNHSPIASNLPILLAMRCCYHHPAPRQLHNATATTPQPC